MTLQQFDPVFAMLAVQLRATDVDEATIRAYHRVLEDLEPEFVEEAARRLARVTNEDGQAWFPKSAEWLQMAVRVEAETQEQQRAFLRKLPAPLCLACLDTSWAMVADGSGVVPCDCRRLRRLELLGRRPWPALPEAKP